MELAQKKYEHRKKRLNKLKKPVIGNEPELPNEKRRRLVIMYS